MNAKTDDPIEPKLYVNSHDHRMGEGDLHPFYLRPTNNVTKWNLRHALTHLNSDTPVFPSRTKTVHLATFEIESTKVLEYLKNLQFQSKSNGAKLKLLKEKGRRSGQKV